MDSLPKECLFRIFQYLPIEDILRTSQSSKALNQAARESYLWRSLFLRDFGRGFWREPSEAERAQKFTEELDLADIGEFKKGLASSGGSSGAKLAKSGTKDKLLELPERNLWQEKYIDNLEKFREWKSSRNYSYFFKGGKSFGICRVIITGMADCGKTTMMFSLKKLLEETKGRKRQRSGSFSQALSKLSLKKKNSEIPSLPDIPPMVNGCYITPMMIEEKKYIFLDVDMVTKWAPCHEERVNLLVYCVNSLAEDFSKNLQETVEHFKATLSGGEKEPFGLLVLATKADQQNCIDPKEICSKLGLEDFGTKTFKNCEMDAVSVSCFSKSSLFTVLEKLEDLYLKLFEE